jgi:hypothetical protein
MNPGMLVGATKEKRRNVAIPPTLSEEFLLWFRARTEAGWKKIPVYSVDADPEEEIWEGKWHPAWRGARWLEPLPDEEIRAIEAQWQICFPPDYRLFFKWLHATDIPHLEMEMFPGEYVAGLFYNWQREPTAIRWAYEHILGGFAFDALHNTHFWRSEWGAVPGTEEEARERLKPIVDAAPRLIPLYTHRYLLAEPCRAGNPVLSIWQSDIIVYAPDLRTYLLAEWSRHPGSRYTSGRDLLHLTTHDQKEVNEERKRLMTERKHIYKNIPFWGEYLNP